ncbi:MAG: hypothetical protein Kow0079_02420 [Vicingaceae bacterium]
MSSLKPYPINYPVIKSGNVYTFETDSNLLYEVRFGRKANDILSTTIVFGVTNDEFEGEEYIVTNKGEVYRVMATIVEIVRIYKEIHPNVHTFEFSGEPTKNEKPEEPTIRLKLYKRYIERIFDNSWKVESIGNKVIIYRK